MLTTDLERRMSDTMEASAAALVSRLRACQSRMRGFSFCCQALQEQKDTDRTAVHTVIKEQMHKLKHDFLSKFQACH